MIGVDFLDDPFSVFSDFVSGFLLIILCKQTDFTSFMADILKPHLKYLVCRNVSATRGFVDAYFIYSEGYIHKAFEM